MRWGEPCEGWCKLNTNGTFLGNPGKVGRGNWIKGSIHSKGMTTSVMAEFWALRDGLLLASQMGITLLEVELDAKVVVDLVLSKSISNRAYSSLLNDCRYLLSKFQQVQVNHVFREANRCAHGLAKRGRTQLVDFVVLNEPLLLNFIFCYFGC